ncbi:late competence development ComFB family protein [Aeromonas rivuli]|jgi:hypothetical protein|uniref:late competence development ComFB family protein n=1 Tax=Aeromonas TaxID=642 RepID=UPI0005AB23EB|nr:MULTISPECIES: late competence development ComFB family protein [Aeromonas]MCS3456354.1 hypothetical protein [Aeromonas sp. BIGb0405]MCS3460386.1 hypothetical protein [Aeromonas sp. BIGb0445]UBO74551.1 late competence development ComFB family protein [Aeromonas rivuli]
MKLSTEIHNFYEQLVSKAIVQQDLARRLSDDELADLCCLTLNQLPAHYIRHDVDMIYFLSQEKRDAMEQEVRLSLAHALVRVQSSASRD